jgi:hypothetical protein
MFSDWAALHDISHGEPDTRNEWSFLRMGLIINFIFYIIGFITIIKIRREVVLTPYKLDRFIQRI